MHESGAGCRERHDRYEAYVERNWQEHGLAQVVVLRQRSELLMDVGVFLVDSWCLGVKNALSEPDLPTSDAEELLDRLIPETSRERIHPSCARKLIENALAYAETLGFTAHRDYRKARRILSGIDASLCPTEFTFGRDGRPCFVQGPDDSEERIERVLALLEARLGPDGFDYELAEEEDDDAGDEDIGELREGLMDVLAAEPTGSVNFYYLSGLLTALELCPQRIAIDAAIARLWPEGRPGRDDEDAKAFTAALQLYQDYLATRISRAILPDAGLEESIVDVWERDLPEVREDTPYDAVPFVVSLYQWAAGFWRATQEWPEAWQHVLERADLAPHWEIVRWWADFPSHRDKIAAAADATPARNIGTATRGLAQALSQTR